MKYLHKYQYLLVKTHEWPGEWHASRLTFHGWINLTFSWIDVNQFPLKIKFILPNIIRILPLEGKIHCDIIKKDVPGKWHVILWHTFSQVKYTITIVSRSKQPTTNNVNNTPDVQFLKSPHESPIESMQRGGIVVKFKMCNFTPNVRTKFEAGFFSSKGRFMFNNDVKILVLYYNWMNMGNF